MCKWGKYKKVKVIHQNKKVKVDKCLVRLVKVLNKYGIETIACCCGHGKTAKSGIIISSKNILFTQLEDNFSVHLQFPYREKK